MKKSLTQLITGVGVVSSGLVPSLAHADFIKDSSGTLDLKNYYFNRDYREAASQSMRAEWAKVLSSVSSPVSPKAPWASAWT